MGDAAAVAGEELDVGFVDVHRMDADEVAAEHAEAGEARERPAAVGGERVGDLLRGLVDVHMDRQLELVGERLHVAEALVRDGVGGVRGDREAEQRVALPAVACGQSLAQVVIGVARVRGGELQRDRAHDRAHARRGEGFRRGLGMEVHVAAGGDATPDHLGRCEQGAVAHESRADVAALRRPDRLLQPAHQRQVVGDAAQQAHRGMGVEVDQARDQHVLGQLDHLVRGVARARRVLAEQVDDASAADRDRVVGEHGVVRIDGDDPAGVDQQVDGFAQGRLLGGRLRDGPHSSMHGPRRTIPRGRGPGSARRRRIVQQSRRCLPPARAPEPRKTA